MSVRLPLPSAVRRFCPELLAVLLAVGTFGAAAPSSAPPLTGSNLQAAIDAQPGRPLHLPAGEYRLDRPLEFRVSGGGLHGEGTLIQTNNDADIVRIVGADHVRIEGISLIREQPVFFKSARAVFAERSHHLILRHLTVRGNRASPAAILLYECDYATLEGCSVIDFKTVTIDDRMKNDLYRYAFRALDGHGMYLRLCRAPRILRNRIIETELRATEEVMRRHDLGLLVDRAPELGRLASYGVRDGRAFIWHQGGGIALSGATRTAHALVDGNFIENAAQGMDLHADFLIVTNNHVTNAYMGMKVFHGGRGVVIANNVFHRPAKYGLLLRPGSESWPASPAADGRPAREENVQRGFVVANNVITDMGYGDEHWHVWNDDPAESSPVAIKIGTGPLPSNPRLADLILQGNIVHDHGRDGVLVDGRVEHPAPRYKWALWFDEEWRAANVRLSANILHPGSLGVSNLPIEP
jgi:hypothetical protein